MAQRESPRSLIDRAVEVMGGTAFRQLHAVRLIGSSTDELSSISPAGAPTVPLYQAFSELRDLDGLRFRRSAVASFPLRPNSIPSTEVLDSTTAVRVMGDRTVPGSPSQWRESYPWLRHGIERVLFRALAATDLAMAADTTIAGRPVRTVAFDHDRDRVYLDRATDLPVAIGLDQRFVDDPTWGMWGTLRTITVYGTWAWLDGGIRYPMVRTVYRGGRSIRHVMIRRVELDPPTPSDSFPITDVLREGFAARDEVRLGNGTDSTAWLAPGVLAIPGPFTVYLVRQGRNYVVLGTPHSRTYMRLVLAEAERWFPGGQPVAAVATSATWPHMAGIGELVARGIPILASPETSSLIREVVAANGGARAPRITEVRDSSVIGAGADRLVLFANHGRGATHEDQLVAWLPERGILYAADLFRPERFEPNLWRQPLAELRELAARHDLVPVRVVSIHISSTPWSDVLAPLSGGSAANR